jgi:hypothetical protein
VRRECGRDALALADLLNKLNSSFSARPADAEALAVALQQKSNSKKFIGGPLTSVMFSENLKLNNNTKHVSQR